MNTEAELADYFRDAQSWDADRAAQFRRSARLAWWIAAAGWVCAVASDAALVALMPLKRVEPYVVRVDDRSGIVDVVPIYAGNVAQPEAVTRYFLTHYLTVCERFAYATAESDYEECGAFNSASLNQAWFAKWTPTNPSSPLNLYKDGTTVRVEVQSVSFFTRASGLTDLAQVRYLKAMRPAAGAGETFSHWIATLQYAYASPPKDPKVRRWNPLGFRILEFKTEPEVSVTSPGDKEAAHDHP